MCGIIGYVGDKQAAPILIEGLSRLEYRGYDSAGIAVFSHGQISVKKSRGRLSVLSEMINGGKNVQGRIGIGHTRWATHGEPSDENSHPQTSQSGRFAVVHNGIIENYIALKEKLMAKGIKFVSETDTEVVAHMFEYYFNGDPVQTLAKVIHRLEGSYALGILCLDNPEEFFAVKKSSPLIVGLGENENFIASDVTAILNHTRKIYYLDDDEIVVVKKDCVNIYNTDGEEIVKAPCVVDWDVTVAEKDGFEHFMMKEIHQQPKVMAETINPRISGGEIVLDKVSLTEDDLKDINKIFIIGCGSAYHVGMVGKYIIENLCRIPVEPVVASEFRYSNPIITKRDLAIIISQSGETADTLAALREAKERGARTIGVVNVVGSSIANMADDVIYTWAGPEIAVASTKAYQAQLCVIYMLAVYMAHILQTITAEEYLSYITQLKMLPDLVEQTLQTKNLVQFLASKFFNCHSIFFMGRNIDYAVSLEGSLKLKEISYIHSEAYAAGELKHGTISLIEDGTLVVAIATVDELYYKTMSNIKEVKARGGAAVSIVGCSGEENSDAGDYIIEIPKTSDIFMPSLAVIPLQLFAYYVASLKGCDIDKPRNLAKSVTVE